MRGWLMTLVLALGASVLTLVTPVTSHAAPPEVTASENPVLIAYPHFTTKDITLTWTLAPDSPQANLIVREGNATVHNQPLFSATGTTPLTVTYDRVYTAQLVRTFGGQPLGDPLTITTDKPTGEMTCAQRCIKSIDVAPHGGWAQFDIKTTETAVITVEASTKAPNPDGTWSNPEDVAAFVGTVLPTDSYTPPLANLQPNTTYHYVVRAHVKGHEQIKKGTFKTLTRRVEVNFAEVQMIDDSDGPFDGNCDCWFWFGVGDELPKDWGHWQDQQSVGSDTTVHPNVTISLMNAPPEVRLGARGHDDDQDPLEFCATAVGRPNPNYMPVDWPASADVSNCLDFAGNQSTVSLSRQGPSYAPGDVDEQFTAPFTIAVNGQLVFNVRGTYRVSYE